MMEPTCALAADRLREAAATQKEARRLEEQKAHLEREWSSDAGGDEAAAARRRAELRRDTEAIEARIGGLMRRSIELAQEARAVNDDCGALARRCAQKQDELATVADADRAGIEEELAGLLVQRYIYERDEKLLQRAGAIRQGILERAGEVLIREAWVRIPSGAVIRESELGAHGGVGVTVIGRNSRVPKERARLLGIVE